MRIGIRAGQDLKYKQIHIQHQGGVCSLYGSDIAMEDSRIYGAMESEANSVQAHHRLFHCLGRDDLYKEPSSCKTTVLVYPCILAPTHTKHAGGWPYFHLLFLATDWGQ